MRNNKYKISIEVSGEEACFARPDSGINQMTYPVITPSACKGLLESICFMRSVEVKIDKVAICNPIQYQTDTFNSHTSERKSDLHKNHEALQLNRTILRNVRYKIFGHVKWSTVSPEDLGDAEGRYVSQNVNQPHAYQSMLRRYISRGRYRRLPCLGKKNMVCDDFGPVRDDTYPLRDLNFEIPNMLISNFNNPVCGTSVSPKFRTVKVINGVVNYAY